MTTSEQLHGQGPGDIRELLARIKNGDEEAARELLSRYESKVRLVVRRQLPRLLRSRFDSIDFLQSVWGSFFHRIQTESERPERGGEPDRVPGLGRAEQGHR